MLKVKGREIKIKGECKFDTLKFKHARKQRVLESHRVRANNVH